ncbi:hypothetical protein REA19_16660 [Prescottella equi]|nr:hypothetical protein REA19_16660 [Prescottella equi]
MIVRNLKSTNGKCPEVRLARQIPQLVLCTGTATSRKAQVIPLSIAEHLIMEFCRRSFLYVIERVRQSAGRGTSGFPFIVEYEQSALKDSSTMINPSDHHPIQPGVALPTLRPIRHM